MWKLTATAALIALAIGCGNDTSGKNNGGTNNGGTNNGGSNNGGTNNGGTNNGDTNNGSTNNGSTNNGSTNNGSTNNGSTNNGTNNGTTNNGTTAVDPDLAEVEDGLWNAFCEAMFQCPNRNTAQLIVFVGGRFADEAACKASEFRGELSVAQSQMGIDAGRVSLDPTKTDGCVAAFKTVWCDPEADPAPLDACDGLWTGTVATGANCALQEECVDGNFCDLSGDQCYGTCVTDPGTMITCGNETCDTTTQYCGQQGQMMRCFDRKLEGAACDSSDECVDGSGCLDGAQGGSCTAYGSVEEGDLCGGVHAFCASDAICVGQIPRCEVVTFNEDGESCDFTATFCEAGVACQDLTLAGGTCGAPRPENGDCQASFQCEMGLYCDGFDIAMPLVLGACLPRRVDGEVCAANDECASEYCNFANPDDATGTCGTNRYCSVP